MSAVTRSDRAAGVPRDVGALPAGALEVRTTSSDTLRAALVVEGTLCERTAALLLGVLGTHIRAGRRYLRVDLTAVVLEDTRVVTALADAHRSVDALGGMLVFDGADETVAALLLGGDLHVSPLA